MKRARCRGLTSSNAVTFPPSQRVTDPVAQTLIRRGPARRVEGRTAGGTTLGSDWCRLRRSGAPPCISVRRGCVTAVPRGAQSATVARESVAPRRTVRAPGLGLPSVGRGCVPSVPRSARSATVARGSVAQRHTVRAPGQGCTGVGWGCVPVVPRGAQSAAVARG